MAKDDSKGASNWELAIKGVGAATTLIVFLGGLFLLRRRRLVRQISRMIEVLTSIKGSLQRMEIPRQHGHEFLELINLTDPRLGVLRQRYPALGVVFRTNLIRIGDQLRNADILIGERRAAAEADYVFRQDEWQGHPSIADTCAEIERTVGILNAMVTEIDPLDLPKPPKSE